MENWKERLPEAVHDKDNIKGFFGDYRWLSNFHPCLVEYEGLTYSSSEGAYEAAKCKDYDVRHYFVVVTASKAKVMGKNVVVREDWEHVKLAVMEDILRSKFTKNQELKERLLATGKAYLEETNWWNDQFWGVCKGKGKNHLGWLLMSIRNELQITKNSKICTDVSEIQP